MQPGQMMQEFSEMMRQQQQLLDRSFRRSQQYGRNGGKPGDNEADSRAQEDLRRRLGEMMNRLAEGGAQMPDTLGHADRAMRDARDALKRGEPGDAMQGQRSEEHTSELQSLMRISYAGFCLKKKKETTQK